VQSKLFLLFAYIFIIIACPEPPDTLECGPYQVEINGECECEEGYHWNEDQTECLMDTTSHNFIWEIDTLGVYGSYLKDVTIVNENDIWVVGEIIMLDPDSTNGTGYKSYNAAHWDGNEWELIQIQPQGYVQPLHSIFIVDENDIWFGRGSLPIHYNGSYFDMLTPADDGYPGGFLITAIWGTSSDNIYFVGGSGSIVHYDGSSFELIESGTDVNLIDIDGTPDGEYVYITGNNDQSESILLELHDNEVNQLYYANTYFPENNYGMLASVFVDQDVATIASVAGIWNYNYLSKESTLISRYDALVEDGRRIKYICGNGNNDYFIIEACWQIIHFNGSTFSINHEISDRFDFMTAYTKRADTNGDMCVITGYCCLYGHAIAVRGYR